MVLPARDREALEQAVGRGSELLRQGKLDQAQRAFRAALELDPESSRVLALLGLAHFRANEFSDARAVYEQLVERAPTDASHRLNLGLVYLKLNDADRAISALEASRALDPSQGRAVSYLGLAYARGGRYAEAYRAFLIAGQNELAVEIETNLTQAERDRIHGQLGRSPQGFLPTARTVITTLPRTPTPTGLPRTPTPTGVPRTPTPTSIPGTSAPTGEPPSASAAGELSPAPPASASTRMDAATGAAATTSPNAAAATSPSAAEPVPRASAPSIPESDLKATIPIRTLVEGVTRTPTPVGLPRTKPPSAPPGKRRSQELAAAAPPSADAGGSVATVHDVLGKIHIDSAAAVGAVSHETVQLSAPQDRPRASDSMQFVLPRGEPAAPQQSLDGASMISRAVASAMPAPVGLRTRGGGSSPRPLAELTTDQLIRPDEGDDAFEVAAGGALIIRVTDRVMTRLDGVSITGGDLSYEVATRRSRGHPTDEPFDYGGAQLHAVNGRGYLIAVPGEYTFGAVSLDDDILYLREDLVFAFQAQLRWENGNVPGLRGRLPVVQFRGNGALAMRLPRPVVHVKLPAQGTLFVDADLLAGWIGRVIPRAVVPPPGGPLGTMCVECTGEGVVLVEAAPRDVTDVPRVTAKWPRVTVEPFPTGPLLVPPVSPLPGAPIPSAEAPGGLSGAPAEATAGADDTVPTPAEPAAAADPNADRDHLGDLGF